MSNRARNSSAADDETRDDFDVDTFQEATEEPDEPPELRERPSLRRSRSSTLKKKGPVEIVKAKVKDTCARIGKSITSSSGRIPIGEHWDMLRKALAHILNLNLFECFMGCVILFNIALIIVETDRRLLCEDPESPDCAANHQDIKLPDMVCLVLYSIELLMRMYVYQCMFVTVRWNVFDFLIVLVSILGEFVGSIFKDAVLIRAIRVLRLVRMLRLLTIFQELYRMIAAMASTLRTIFWAGIMLGSVLAVCSLIAVDLLRPLVKKLHEEQRLGCTRCVVAFDSVTASMITFFQTVIMGEGIGDLMIPLIEEDYTAAAFILVTVAFVYLGFSSLILSVIVDKANEARCSDAFYQALMQKKLRGESRRILVEFWKNAGMEMESIVTLDELRYTYETQESFRSYFRQMDIDMGFLEVAFESKDNGEGECSFEELADAVVRMKNTDVGPVVSVVKFQMEQVMKEMNNLSSKMNSLQSDLRVQSDMAEHKMKRTETMFQRSMSRVSDSALLPRDYSPDAAGGGPLTTMMSWLGTTTPRPDAPGSTDRRHLDESERDYDGESHVESHMGTGSGWLKSFTDSKESPARGSNGKGGRGEYKPWQKTGDPEKVMAAAAGDKELQALQKQAQEVEHDIRNLKSKLATDSGSKKAERRQDMKILTEILADIRGHEAQKKREISAAMGLATDVRDRREERAAEKRRRDIKRELEWSA